MAIRIPFPFRIASLFWVFAAWIVFLFLSGGSARGDIASLLLLRPLAVLLCAVLLFTLSRGQIAGNRTILLLIAATIALVALHLVPLPPAIWQSLPERELIARIDSTVGLGSIWRPLTVSPPATWNALYSLSVPLSVALYMIRFGPDRWSDLVPVILLLGLACMILGLLQITAASPGSFLYPYRVSNFGAPIGLFANRNHTGAFLAAMLPWLAVFASYRRGNDPGYRLRVWIAVISAPIVLLFLLLLGSRAGLLLGSLGLLSMPLIHSGAGPHSSAKRRIAAIFALLAAMAAIGVAAILASRAESLERLLGVEEGESYRLTTFFPILRLAGEYFPLGSGIGSFVTVYQRYEPADRLEPRYLNHAHNDLLELLLTGGLPAMALLACFGFFAIRPLIRSFGRGSGDRSLVRMKKAAGLTLCLFALASIVDYPLRTPALLGFATIMAVIVMYSRNRVEQHGHQADDRANNHANGRAAPDKHEMDLNS